MVISHRAFEGDFQKSSAILCHRLKKKKKPSPKNDCLSVTEEIKISETKRKSFLIFKLKLQCHIVLGTMNILDIECCVETQFSDTKFMKTH